MSGTAIENTDFHFPGQIGKYTGKVREVYELQGDVLVMIATDRISAFDHILPKPIPYKGEVLNQIAAHFLEVSRQVVPNWLLGCPHPAVSVGVKAEPIRIEMVIRGYCVGHAWRAYQDGARSLCGVPLPEGIKENMAFPQPIITPATKAPEGHDMDISRDEILDTGLVSPQVYAQMENYTRQLYELGTKMAHERGLILADTKYEFGLYRNEVILIDEVHTPDSSRYFYLDGYERNLAQGLPQTHLSKEFVREWLIQQGFQGLEGQQMPMMDQERVNLIQARYFELFHRLMGKPFDQSDRQNHPNDMEQCIIRYLQGLPHWAV